VYNVYSNATDSAEKSLQQLILLKELDSSSSRERWLDERLRAPDDKQGSINGEAVPDDRGDL